MLLLMILENCDVDLGGFLGCFRGLPEQNGERILHRGGDPSRSFLQGIYYPYPSRMKIKRLRYPRKLRNLLEKQIETFP
jgi:hypothetical protein